MIMQITDKYIRPLLSALGYYKIKRTIKMHFYLKRLEKEDVAKRRKIDEAIWQIPDNVLKGDNDLIVSLTSYGSRIVDTLPYTLYSLLMQDFLPGRIVVYLSREEISKETLPPVLRKIEKCGVNFCYVEDIKSYKKLIPALSMFQDNPILTVDDDMYYTTIFCRSFWNCYEQSDKKTVLGSVGRWVTRDKNGNLLPYLSWYNIDDGNPLTDQISFFGCGGCLYPPLIFDDEISKKDIFMRFAPSADDIWFWVMEQRAGVKTKLIPEYTEHLYVPIDRTTWFDLDRDDCLTTTNDVKGLNNQQLKSLQTYYGIK